MAVWDINANQLTVINNIDGEALNYAYNLNKDIVFTKIDPYIDGRTLVFEDSFDGDVLNQTNWSCEIGDVRNSELQFYRNQNVSISNSNLILTAKKENHVEKNWTSGSITGQSKKAWKYGRFEAKIKFPNVSGAFGAFWTLGANHHIIYGSDDGTVPVNNNPEGSIGWSTCGEIDIIETIPGNTLRPKSNLWDNEKNSLGNGSTLSDIDIGQYHIYSIEWTSEYIAALVDNIEYKRWTFADYTSDKIQAYHLEHYIILNLAVGVGGGTPSQSTEEMKMFVEWVRVYAPLSV